jgi:hypothetical protein
MSAPDERDALTIHEGGRFSEGRRGSLESLAGTLLPAIGSGQRARRGLVVRWAARGGDRCFGRRPSREVPLEHANRDSLGNPTAGEPCGSGVAGVRLLTEPGDD